MSISLNKLSLRPSMIPCDMLLMWEVVYISNHNLYGSDICIFCDIASWSIYSHITIHFNGNNGHNGGFTLL
jgi:hypothetical protein